MQGMLDACLADHCGTLRGSVLLRNSWDALRPNGLLIVLTHGQPADRVKPGLLEPRQEHAPWVEVQVSVHILPWQHLITSRKFYGVIVP